MWFGILFNEKMKQFMRNREVLSSFGLIGIYKHEPMRGRISQTHSTEIIRQGAENTYNLQFEKQTLNVDSFISAQSNILTEFDNHLFCNSHLTCSHKDAAIWSILMYDFTISLKWIISSKSLLSRPSIRNNVASRMSSERFSSKNTYSSQPNKSAAFSSNPIGISRSPLS